MHAFAFFYHSLCNLDRRGHSTVVVVQGSGAGDIRTNPPNIICGLRARLPVCEQAGRLGGTVGGRQALGVIELYVLVYRPISYRFTFLGSGVRGDITQASGAMPDPSPRSNSHEVKPLVGSSTANPKNATDKKGIAGSAASSGMFGRCSLWW